MPPDRFRPDSDALRAGSRPSEDDPTGHATRELVKRSGATRLCGCAVGASRFVLHTDVTGDVKKSVQFSSEVFA